ncbi:MAG: putative motility protein [Fibrobacter sp.]|nr:putative motility protein [Fibrobacter sp.]
MNIANVLSAAGGDAMGEIGIAMLKKAQDAEASAAAQLVDSLPPPPTSASAPGVGTKVDVVG